MHHDMVLLKRVSLCVFTGYVQHYAHKVRLGAHHLQVKSGQHVGCLSYKRQPTCPNMPQDNILGTNFESTGCAYLTVGLSGSVPGVLCYLGAVCPMLRISR